MSRVISRYIQIVSVIVIFLGLIGSSVSRVYAQSDCGEYESRKDIPVYIIDESANRWGPYADSCIPASRTPATIFRTSTSPNYVDTHANGIVWQCNTGSSAYNGGGYRVRTFRCDDITGEPMSVTLVPPSGYGCGNVTWNYTGKVNMSGSGCVANITVPPDLSNAEKQELFFNMSPTSTSPTPTPYACPGTFNATCNAAGNQVTLSWNGTGAPQYAVRANASADSSPGPVNWTDWYYTAQGDWYSVLNGTSLTNSVIPGKYYRWSVESLPYSGATPDSTKMCLVPTQFRCTPPLTAPITPPTNTPTVPPTIPPTLTPTPNPVCQDFSVTPISPSRYSTTPNLYFEWYITSQLECHLNIDIPSGGTASFNPISFPSGGRYRCSMNVNPGTYGLTGSFQYRASFGNAPYTQCTQNNYCLDASAPTTPVPTLSIVSGNRIQVSWNPVSDASCAGLHATPYRVQLSQNSGFTSVWPGSWFNSWQASTSQTSAVACTPGLTYYAHVRSRDAVENESLWSSTVSIVCPALIDTPTPTPVVAACSGGALSPLGFQCDDGNASYTNDSCDTYGGAPESNGPCTYTFCGDGARQPIEACDDGASSGNDDMCVINAGACQVATCGDGFVCSDASCTTGPGGGPEQCDPGAGAGCNADCSVNATYSNLCHFPPF